MGSFAAALSLGLTLIATPAVATTATVKAPHASVSQTVVSPATKARYLVRTSDFVLAVYGSFRYQAGKSYSQQHKNYKTLVGQLPSGTKRYSTTVSNYKLVYSTGKKYVVARPASGKSIKVDLYVVSKKKYNTIMKRLDQTEGTAYGWYRRGTVSSPMFVRDTPVKMYVGGWNWNSERILPGKNCTIKTGDYFDRNRKGYCN